MKKKNNTYQFLNLIEEKEFNNYNLREKEKFLIDNKIYLPRESSLEDSHWLYDFDYSNIYEISDHFYFITEMNDLFIREILRYCEGYGGFLPGYSNYKKRIKRIINMTLDNIDKEKVIRQEYSKYLDILNANYMTEEYFEKNIKENDFYSCASNFGIDEMAVYKFITDKHPYLGDEFPFNECNEIKKCIKILKLLKEELSKIKSSNIEKNNRPKSITSLSFNDEIFRTIEAQNWFNETLINMGALGRDSNPIKRRFQPVCSAIFYLEECKTNILKYNLELQYFIAFLNKEYKTTIKSKLSSGINHESEVENHLEKYIPSHHIN